jgi:hypothetical protein
MRLTARLATCGERQVWRPDLPLPSRVREPWPVHHRPFYLQLHVSWQLSTPVDLR